MSETGHLNSVHCTFVFTFYSSYHMTITTEKNYIGHMAAGVVADAV